MPSIISAAAGLMALSGLATAFPQNGFTNTTTSAVGTTGNATASAVGTNNSTSTSTSSASTSTSSINPLTESLYCPTLSGSIILSRTGAEFLLNCGTNHFGVVIEVVANSTLYSRAVVAPANIQDCTLACDSVSACVGTSFNTAARTCTLYSDVGVAYDDADSDFAIRVSTAAATTVSAGQTLTTDVYSTNVVTISSCAPTVTDCPLDAATAGPVTVTQVIPVTSTDYICPTATVIPASPVACSCAFSASTATVYSTTVLGGQTTVVPVSTVVVAVPSPSMTGVSTTTIAQSKALTTAPITTGVAAAGSTTTAGSNAGSNAGASATTSTGLAEFTGAASNVKAGMGLIAGVAGLAFML